MTNFSGVTQINDAERQTIKRLAAQFRATANAMAQVLGHEDTTVAKFDTAAELLDATLKIGLWVDD